MSAPTVIVTDPATLARLVEAAVAKVLAQRTEDPAPALLDRSGIARALGVGTSTVDRLRREGMPAIQIGDSPRFEVRACLAWLRSRPDHD